VSAEWTGHRWLGSFVNEGEGARDVATKGDFHLCAGPTCVEVGRCEARGRACVAGAARREAHGQSVPSLRAATQRPMGLRSSQWCASSTTDKLRRSYAGVRRA
jgi:hypothetical protein